MSMALSFTFMVVRTTMYFNFKNMYLFFFFLKLFIFYLLSLKDFVISYALNYLHIWLLNLCPTPTGILYFDIYKLKLSSYLLNSPPPPPLPPPADSYLTTSLLSWSYTCKRNLQLILGSSFHCVTQTKHGQSCR